MSDTIWVAIITALATTVPQIIIAIINYYKDYKYYTNSKYGFALCKNLN